MSYLDVDVAAYERGDFDGDDVRILQLFSDLLVSGAVPEALRAEVDHRIAEGDLSPQGDIIS